MDHTTIMEYKAPSWATDWCPSCGWSTRCAQCRAVLVPAATRIAA